MTNNFKLNKKFVTAFVLVALFVSTMFAALPVQAVDPDLPEIELTVVGADGTQIVLDEDDIDAMTHIYGEGAMVKTRPPYGTSGPFNYTGVGVAELCDLVGGLVSKSQIYVYADDGYWVDFTYEQVHDGIFETWEQTVPNTEPTNPQDSYGMNLILAYYIDMGSGNELIADGPLRSVPVGDPTDRYTTSSYWNKYVNKVAVIGGTTSLTVAYVPDTVDRTVPEDATISGVLTDVTAAAGIAGKTISLYRSEGANWVRIGQTTTEADGSYSYDWTPNVPNGYYHIKAEFAQDTEYFESTAQTEAPMLGVHVVPEYTLGALLAIAACFAALLVYRKTKTTA
ncbi:MAG: hypothetical protein NWF04_02245 [Candidatus Bathyarchaeota archaeon]|nr:hypothetical protein [Candidatus Bathyarchaeota archaeon]